MNEDLDALESELRGFRPQPTSPALRGRIAERLAEAAPSPSSLRQRLALAGGLIAAGLALTVVLNVVGPAKRDTRITSRGGATAHPGLPTIQSYRQALARSPEALDTLLDEQAVYTSRPGAQPRPLTAFAASDRTFLIWRGDR